MTIDEIRRVVREELLGKGVAVEFRELVQTEGGDSFLPRQDWIEPDVYVQSEELEKLGRGEPLSLMKNVGVVDSSWDDEASAPLKKRAPQDGQVVEKCGKQTWTYTYSNGALVRSMVQDPDLPGGSMYFDQEGNEIAAA